MMDTEKKDVCSRSRRLARRLVAIRHTAAALRKMGHEVFTPTHTGVGERAHQADESITGARVLKEGSYPRHGTGRGSGVG
jgi:hypothetical protein